MDLEPLESGEEVMFLHLLICAANFQKELLWICCLGYWKLEKFVKKCMYMFEDWGETHKKIMAIEKKKKNKKNIFITSTLK